MLGLLLASLSASTESGPFGESQQYYWVCEARIERDDTLLTGQMTMDSDGRHLGMVQWQSRRTIAVDDYRYQSGITQSGVWFGDTLHSGTLTLAWNAPRNLPRVMTISYGGSAQNGGFVSGLYREDRREAKGRISLGALLRWGAGQERVNFTIATGSASLVQSDFLGGGWIDMAVYRQLEIDFAELKRNLEGKAVEFQSECRREEREGDPIII